MHKEQDENQVVSERIKPSQLKRAGWIALLIAGIVVGWGLFTRNRDARETHEWTQRQAIPTVAVIQSVTGEISTHLVLPGNLQPYIEAPIFARVNGYLKTWYHDIGAEVKAGELLAEIDTPELDQQLDQGKANLASAMADEKLAEVTAKRWTSLLATDSVSQQDADEKVANLAAQRAKVDAAQANLGRIEAFETFKRVVAPFDGVITARKTDVGALITEGSGTELFNVSRVDPLRLYVPVPQNYSRQIQPGIKATIRVPEHSDQVFEGILTRTSESISGASGTLLAELAVSNREGLLTPGGYAEVTFKLPEDKAIHRVPASALIFRKSGMQVAVVDASNHIVLKNVILGRDYGSEVEVLSGVAPQDRIVDSPPDSLSEGDLVHPVDADALKGQK